MPKRTFKGTCALCGASVDKRRSTDHHGPCAAAQEGGQSRAATLLTFRVTATGGPKYWLDIEADAAAALSKLDAFLRNTWVECCGHLSMFSVSGYRYSTSPSAMSGLLGRANPERSMRAKIGDVFGRIGDKGIYDYDFGSTTRLAIACTGGRDGRIGKQSVRLLVRNDALPWTCGICGGPSAEVGSSSGLRQLGRCGHSRLEARTRSFCQPASRLLEFEMVGV